MRGVFNDLTGRRFGRWLVVSSSRDRRAGRVIGRKTVGAIKWLCRCDCGVERLVFGETLREGRSVSCGCYHLEVIRHHGMHQSLGYTSTAG